MFSGSCQSVRCGQLRAETTGDPSLDARKLRDHVRPTDRNPRKSQSADSVNAVTAKSVQIGPFFVISASFASELLYLGTFCGETAKIRYLERQLQKHVVVRISGHQEAGARPQAHVEPVLEASEMNTLRHLHVLKEQGA